MQVNHNTETKTEHVIASVLTQEVKQSSRRLEKMRDSLNNYHEKQQNAPKPAKQESKPDKTESNIGGFSENDRRERIILDWAKIHYKDYKSINDFPFHQYAVKPKITAGVVYLCLKKTLLYQTNGKY
jgi:hypothetical protein